MNERSAQSGVNAEELDFERMRQAIHDMALSANALAEAFRNIGRAGVSMAEMLRDAAKDGAA